MAETVELTIATVVYRGAGLSRDGGIVTFVPGALAGEREGGNSRTADIALAVQRLRAI